MAGKEFVDNGNGRDARATKVTFDNDEGLSVFQWMNDMVDSRPRREHRPRPKGTSTTTSRSGTRRPR